MPTYILNDEEKIIQDTARRFAIERLKDGYQEREKEPTLNRALLREMGDLGLLTPNLDEQYGGINGSSVVCGLIAEQIAYGDFNLSYLNMTNALIGQVIQRNATEDMKQEILPKMAAGEIIIGLGLTEPRGGSDAANLIVSAKSDGDDYILNGEKTSISYCQQSEYLLMFVRTGEVTQGAHGVTCILCPLDAEGITTTAFDDIGTKPVGRGSVFFDNVRVPKSSRLGNEGEGFTKIMVGFDLSRIIIALQCIGATQASIDETWQYGLDREAFGMPLIKYQGFNFQVAEFESKVEACRTLAYHAMKLRDEGLPHTKEAAMIKWMAPKWCTDILQACCILHGHYGYSSDFPHQQRMRDVMGLQIGDGTANIMKMIIARETVGHVSVQYK